MKKEIVVVFIIFVLIITGHIVTQKYTENFFYDLEEDLNKLEESLLEEIVNFNMVKKQIDEIQQKWDEKYNVLAYYIEHDELEKVETQITIVRASVEADDYENAVIELEKNIFLLEHIKDRDAFKLVNIF